MKCDQVFFSSHALRRMFERGIVKEAILEVLENGESIAEYSDDTPYPTRLLLGYWNGQAIHVVAAVDSSRCIVVTAYAPNVTEWSEDFRKRRML